MTNHRNRTPTLPGRVLISPESGTAFHATITRADEPTDEGCPINKATLDELLAASGTTSGTATALTLAQDGFRLTDGACIRFKLHVDSGAAPTINVNGTGARAIMATKYKPMKTTFAGTWCTAIYSETLGFFVLQGSGGEDALRFGSEPGRISDYELYACGRNDPVNYASPLQNYYPAQRGGM